MHKSRCIKTRCCGLCTVDRVISIDLLILEVVPGHSGTVVYLGERRATFSTSPALPTHEKRRENMAGSMMRLRDIPSQSPSPVHCTGTEQRAVAVTGGALLLASRAQACRCPECPCRCRCASQASGWGPVARAVQEPLALARPQARKAGEGAGPP